METYAAYQSHTGRLTGLWFLPNRPKRLNTTNNKKMQDHFMPIKRSGILSFPSSLNVTTRKFKSELLLTGGASVGVRTSLGVRLVRLSQRE
jgi:hypothetical protein